MQETTLDTILNLRLRQSATGYRFTVDSVLLYDFARALTPGTQNVADLCSGSGIVGLLLARNNPALKVTLLEMQDALHDHAAGNIELNGLGQRVCAIQADIREIKPCPALGGLEAVVTNPPFRRAETGRLSQGDERALARHEIALDLPSLLRAARVLLRARGRLYMVYHPDRMLELMDALRAQQLEPKRLRLVHGRLGEPAKIMLVEAVKEARPGLALLPPLIMYETGSEALTKAMQDIYSETQ